jgi:hypothetical protein
MWSGRMVVEVCETVERGWFKAELQFTIRRIHSEEDGF